MVPSSYDDGTKTSSTGTIAGIVVGTLAGVALLCGALFFYFLRYRRRRHNTASQGPVLIDPDLDDDGQPIDYPTVEPYTQAHSRQNTQPNSNESRPGSAGSPTTATTPTSSRAVKSRPRVPLQKPSQASISFSLPYSANDVDIYDPYGRLCELRHSSCTDNSQTCLADCYHFIFLSLVILFSIVRDSDIGQWHWDRVGHFARDSHLHHLRRSIDLLRRIDDCAR